MLFRTRPNRPELDATKIPTSHDIAWAAGIYEGEGCCRLCGRGKRSFMAAVAQKDPELLYRLRDWFGGSVSKGSVNGFVIYNWNICGDRARIFIALIYSYMTARRKEQIDSTAALDFLDGLSSVGMSMHDVKEKLNAMYQKHRETTYDGNPELSRENSRAHYAANRLNPEWVEQNRERNNNARANWTEEQREAARQYQRDRYQKQKQKQNKEKQLLHVVEIKKTA